ncbi:MAG: trypsin-like peptidase domain-containing protein [Solobacterium sp.]|nr:trypsin-like peptidase domain-containing protein [Solobacterium sp.]
MHKLFLISAKMPEDFCFYEQVFREAGFQCVFSRDEDELLLCDAALLYGDEDTVGDEECQRLIGFCRRRSIPLLVIHDDSRFPVEEGVYSAFHTTMPEFRTILYPPKEKEPELSPVQKKILNTFMILFILVPVLLFAYRICMGADGTVLPEEKSAERETVLLDTYGNAAAQIYTISSFGDTIYRGSGYAVSDDGYILSCAHIVDHPSVRYRVVYHLQLLPAELIAVDADRDLALLKVAAATVPLRMSEKEPATGENIWLIGWPEDQPKTILSGTYDGTEVQSGRQSFRLIHLPMYQGVSGSCVINEKGEVVGTAAAMDSNDHTLGLIISYKDCSAFLKEHIFVRPGQ